jgi:uncharacterized protein (TIGR02444 family)
MAGGAKRDNRAAGDAFWRFSLALYARPGVATALVALQDRAGCEVNLALFALWRGAAHACRLNDRDIAAAAAAAAPLSPAVVVPLRALRRRLRNAEDPFAQAMRRRILMLELAGERCVQQRLAIDVADEPGLASAGERLTIATENLAAYLGGATGSPEAAVLRDALAKLMRAPTE